MDAIVEIFLRHARRFRPYAPALPRGFSARLPVTDAPDEAAEDAEPVVESISLAAAIRYVDALGQDSQRRITIRRIDRKEDTYLLHCYCHERRAPRCFRADRIVELVDIESGEVLEGPSEALKAIALLHDAEFDTVEYRTESAARKCRHGLNILVFLARCDGLYHPLESVRF